MKLGYRRVAGAIGVTNAEAGTRGAWVDKRVALWGQLISRGWDVKSFSRSSRATRYALPSLASEVEAVDVLLLEFGGINPVFNGADWDFTLALVREHEGPIYFICDDPDLPFLWDRLPDENWSRWTILVNAALPEMTRDIMGIPKEARVHDYPAHFGMSYEEFAQDTNGKCVYLGRPNSRLKQIKPFLNHLVIAGKEKEWSKFDVEFTPQPLQSERRNFYRQFSAAFAAFDPKHAKSGWRTGRAFHALFSGVPVIVPDQTNKGLGWCWNGSDLGLSRLLDLPQEDRKAIWETQIKSIADLKPDWELIGL